MSVELEYLKLLIEQQKINDTKEIQDRIDRINDLIEKSYGFSQQ